MTPGPDAVDVGPGGPPRVVHLTTIDWSLVVLLLPQLEALQAAGYEVVGVSADGPYVARLRESGIGHVAMRHATRRAAPLRDLAALVEFWWLCRRLRPQIVHTHTPKPGLYGRIAARLAGVPVVVNTVHGLYAQPTDRPAKRWAVYALERLAATCSDAELVQSPEDLAVLRRLRVPEARLHLLGNGVDLERFDPARHADDRAPVRAELGVSDDEVLVGLVGRLVAEKGYREAFAAAQTVTAADPRVRFVVVGAHEPDKADALTAAEVDAARVAGVRFLGNRDDVERLYAAMDVYVLASHREGFPRSAMEAAAMGLPIVATDIRGCRQVVEDGVTGRLVQPRDTVALADALRAVTTDEAARRRMGAAGRRKAVREFDQRHQIALTLGVYREAGSPPSDERGTPSDATA